jgi:putative hydrolase of the HAD superfamily
VTEGQWGRDDSSVAGLPEARLGGDAGLPTLPDQLEAVIFDLGGTLVTYLGEAKDWPAMELPGIRSLFACLAELGLRMDSAAFGSRFVEALSWHWTAATEGQVTPPTVERLIEEVCAPCGFRISESDLGRAVEAYCGPISAQARAVEGALEVAAWLRSQGVRLGVISNTLWPAQVHRSDLARFGLLDLLDVTVFSSECRAWKPDPRIFRAALDGVGARPEAALVVGDRLLEDVRGGLELGMRAVYFRSPEDTTDPGLGLVHPHARVGRLAELPLAILEAWHARD